MPSRPTPRKADVPKAVAPPVEEAAAVAVPLAGESEVDEGFVDTEVWEVFPVWIFCDPVVMAGVRPEVSVK